jgi:hypothetical protein
MCQCKGVHWTQSVAVARSAGQNGGRSDKPCAKEHQCIRSCRPVAAGAVLSAQHGLQEGCLVCGCSDGCSRAAATWGPALSPRVINYIGPAACHCKHRPGRRPEAHRLTSHHQAPLNLAQGLTVPSQSTANTLNALDKPSRFLHSPPQCSSVVHSLAAAKQATLRILHVINTAGLSECTHNI